MTIRGGNRQDYLETWGHPDVLRVEVREPLVGRTILVPEVTHVQEPGPPRVEWIEAKVHASPELNDCLVAFTRLAKTPSDERLAEFAMHWGPLGICKHGWPSTHDNGSCVPLGSRERFWEHHTEQSDWDAAFWTGPGEIPMSEWQGTFWEPLVAWRFYVRKFAAVLNIAQFLREERQGQYADWAEVASLQDGNDMEEEFSKREWKPSSEGIEQARALAEYPLESQRMWLANEVTRWLLRAGVIPWVSWEGSRAQLGLALGRPMVPPEGLLSKYTWHRATLFGLLVTQLAAAVTSSGEPATCGWCTQTYMPERKPPTNRRHFCSPRCQKEAHQAADAEYRRKKRRESKQARTPTDTPTPANASERA